MRRKRSLTVFDVRICLEMFTTYGNVLCL